MFQTVIRDVNFLHPAGRRCRFRNASFTSWTTKRHSPATLIMHHRSMDDVRRQPFDVEGVKRDGLDIDLARVEGAGFDALTAEDLYRLKMHGICSQRTPGLHMFRIRIPGGSITAAQLRGLAATSQTYADGSAHITTRQNLELHSVPTNRLRATLDGIGKVGLTTRGTCGHTFRNVMGCSLTGICPDEVVDTGATVRALHDFYLARADHYNARLPRRLNVYVAGCASCMAHAQINDLGFVGTSRGSEAGYQLWCAGSLGSNPRLAHLLFGFVPAEEVVVVAEAVTDVYCEHGFRDRPAKARLKFLLEEWGVDRFANAVLARIHALRPSSRVARNGVLSVLGPDRRAQGSHQGVFLQKQGGYVRVEARVPLGDLTAVHMDVLASLAEAYGDAVVYLTREQNAELHWIRHENAGAVTACLEEAGLRARGAGSLVDVQVCAGTEWCVWGIGDSRGLAADIEGALADVAADDPAAEPLRVHISGCSHGCAQHQVSDVGLSAVSVRGEDGSAEGFEVFAGGRLGADPQVARRLGKVPLSDTSAEVIDLLRTYLRERSEGEDFASFFERSGRRVGSGRGER